MEGVVAETVRIPLTEMPKRFRLIFERVLRDKQTIMIDAGEEGVVTLSSGDLNDLPSLPPDKTEDDYQAFLDSFGSWADVDTDQLLRDIRASRAKSRLPIDL